MKKKGFTLVELLAVIVILAIILVIAVPKIGNIIDNEKEALYEDTVSKIEKSVPIYLNDHLNLTNNDNFTVSLSTLCNENYLNCPVLDPRTKQSMSGEIMVIGSANGYTYKFMNTTNMLLWYDAEYNNGLNSHSTTTTTWKDLSGNNNNADIVGGVWNNNILQLNSGSYVLTDLFAATTLLPKESWTMTITFSIDSLPYTNTTYGNTGIIFGAANYQGMGIPWIKDESGFDLAAVIRANKSALKYYILNETNYNQKYSLILKNDSLTNNAYLYLNGILVDNVSTTSLDTTYSDNRITYMGNIGINKSQIWGNNYTASYAVMKAYSAIIYNRALTDGEIKHNYEIDKIRYGLD